MWDQQWRSHPTNQSNRRMGKMNLSFDCDAIPKRDVVRNLFRSRLWCRIIPRGVFIDLSPDFDVVIAGFTFPRARRMRLAGF